MSSKQIKRGTLFTVAAPSGTGKTSLVKALVSSIESLTVSVSYTTRPCRPGEENGVNYHFVSDGEFAELVEKGAFLEHAKVFGYHYGTSAEWVEAALQQGKDIILEIDWQGVTQIKQLFPRSVRIFILPPSIEALKERLATRGQDEIEVINHRVAKAKGEIAHYAESDFLVVNDDFELTLEALKMVIESRKLPTLQDKEKNQTLAKQLIS
jgi:guanylate kinase